MVTHDDLETLASLPLFESVPRAELDWLSARGDVQHLEPDTIMRDVGASIEEMWIVLAGRLAVHVAKGDTWRRFYDTGPGSVLGAMPFSRLRNAPARLIVEEKTTLCALARSHFPELVRECPELTSALVHHLLDRARNYRTAELHDERMLSLGRLAAGLAHELNNPASAASSHARALGPLLDDMQSAADALAHAGLTDEQLDAINGVRQMCLDACPPRSPLAAADREDEFSDWLAAHDVDPSAAAALASTNVNLAALDRVARVLPKETLGAAIRWAAGEAAARQTTGHITSATGRIHALVAAVKGFTFMDREAVPDHVDIARGLADTVAMLESKSHAKSVRVRIDAPNDLPAVFGFGSELNQVWEKLIDNAIDAAPAEGNVTVTAAKRGNVIIVHVTDDGPGIPEELRDRIFHPFFTTKPVGSPGLGLDIARRFTHLHDGDLDFTSQSGQTVFRVRLPISSPRLVRPAL